MTTNRLIGSDPIDYLHSHRKDEELKTRLKNKLLGKWSQIGESNGKKQVKRPFNSRSRNAYAVVKASHCITCPTVQKMDQVGNIEGSPEQRSSEKKQRGPSRAKELAQEAQTSKALDHPLDQLVFLPFPTAGTMGIKASEVMKPDKPEPTQERVGSPPDSTLSYQTESVIKSMNILENGVKHTFENCMKYKPKKYAHLIDKIMNKFPQDAPVFGKPAVLINP